MHCMKDETRGLDMQVTPIDIGLFAIVLVVLLGPFLVKKIEHNLEAFLFVMGVLAVPRASWPLF